MLRVRFELIMLNVIILNVAAPSEHQNDTQHHNTQHSDENTTLSIKLAQCL